MKFLTVFLLLFPLIAAAQNPVKLWGEKPDDYRKKKTELFYFPSDSQRVKKAAVIFCPGGSYCYLAKKNEGFHPAQVFNSYGFDAFVLLYRRGIKGNRYPAQRQDLEKALQYVRENYNFDLLGVCGFSAGGHLSGTSAVYMKTDFNIMIYPVVTMQDDIAHKKSRRNLLGQYYSPSLKDSMSLEMNVRGQIPPIFIVACKDDPTVNFQNSVRFADSLAANNKQYKFLLYEHGGHGFGVNPQRIKSQDTTAALWYKEFIKWYKEIFEN